MSLSKLFTPARSTASFDPETLHMLGAVFEDACIGAESCLNTNPLSENTRSLLAQRIIEAATRGERDPRRLKQFALDSIDG